MSVVAMVALVAWRFFLSRSRCPKLVASGVPSSFLKLRLSIPGQDIKLPLLIAIWNVEIDGENAHPCNY